jgi:hypothetical protein
MTELSTQESETAYGSRVALGKIEAVRAELRLRGGENLGGSEPSGMREPRRPGPQPGTGAVSMPVPQSSDEPHEPPPQLPV